MVRADLSVLEWTPSQCCDQFWLVIEDLATSSDAVITTAIANILSCCKASVSLLSVREPLSYYESRLQKMGISVNIHRASNRFRFLDGLYNNALWESSNFLGQTKEQLMKQLRTDNQSSSVLVLDDVDTILEAIRHPIDLIDFIRDLVDEGVGVIAIAHHHIAAHKAVLDCLKDIADAFVSLTRLPSGYTPDLDGQLQVQFFDRRTTPVFHFRQIDGNLSIMQR